MTDVVFSGPQPFALELQQGGTASVESEIVFLTLALVAPGSAGAALQFRLRLTIEHTQQLAEELRAALVMARAARHR